MIVAYVGSGGKTTLIMRRARECVRQGLKVLVTTSTRMYIEPEALLTDDPQPIISRMQKAGLVIAGLQYGEKMGPLPMETYLAVCAKADVVLVEADGSKRMPFKFPADHEPVIYDNTDEIVVVCGLHGLGQPAKEVCHRLSLVKNCLGIDDDTIIDAGHVQKLVIEGYVCPLRARYPGKKLTVAPVCDDTPEQKAAALKIIEEL